MKFLKTYSIQSALALTLFAPGVIHAQATLGDFYTPSYRGQAGSESGFWSDSFTNGYGGPNNASSLAPGGLALANASVTQTTPGAFIIGGSSGDIYSFSSINTFVLDYSVLNPASFPNGIGDIVLQVETAGNELDYSSVLLSYTTTSGTQTVGTARNELYNSGPGGMGSDVLSEWEWTLPLGSDVTSFSIAFNGSDTSVALKKTMLDISAVPEPSTLALVGIVGLGLVSSRFFRRQFSH
jgi:PEP-CTERM motif